MEWSQYEEIIFNYFKERYPNSSIKYNQKIEGRYSKVLRQIDVLIESRIAGRNFRIIIDAKFYKAKIDVKGVETFISMVEDVDAHYAILITKEGYSKAAINRAFYGSKQVELDILNLEELLKELQSTAGIVYSGNSGAIIFAPFGWVLDGKRKEGTLAWLYRRGFDLKDAEKAKEAIYVNIYTYDNSIENIQALVDFQKQQTLNKYSTAKITYPDINIPNKRVVMRKIIREEVDIEEYTILIDCDSFCLFFVLFTPEELTLRNIPKLEYCAERALPLLVDQDSQLEQKIKEVEEKIDKAQSNTEIADLLIIKANTFIKYFKYDEAVKAFNDSIVQLPLNYGARLGLLKLGFDSDKRDTLLNDFYQLSVGNRQICSDILIIGIEANSIEFTENFFKIKIQELEKGMDLAKGNLLFTLAELYFITDKKDKAIQKIKEAKASFEKCFNSKHESIVACVKILSQNKE